MDEYLQKIDMKHIRKLLPAKIDTELNEDLYILRIHYDESYVQKLRSFLEFPCRTDVYLTFFCIKGSVDLEVNLRTFSLCKKHEELSRLQPMFLSITRFLSVFLLIEIGITRYG